jgi:hypothetical protein
MRFLAMRAAYTIQFNIIAVSWILPDVEWDSSASTPQKNNHPDPRLPGDGLCWRDGAVAPNCQRVFCIE